MTHIIVDGSIFDAFRKWLDHRNLLLKMQDKVDRSEMPRIFRYMFLPIKYTGTFIQFIKTKIQQLIACHMCSGFWSGFIIAAILREIDVDPIICNQAGINYWLGLFCFGCCGSIASLLVALMLDFIQRK